MRRGVAVLSLVAGAVLGMTLVAPAAHAKPEGVPGIYGGSDVLGTPFTVAIGYVDADDATWWDRECSAVLWRPRILLTAGHCVSMLPLKESTRRLRVWPVGELAPTGRQSAAVMAGPRVIKVWRPSRYIDLTQHPELPDQPENDIAVILLDRDLAGSAIARLATYEEMSRWAAERVEVVHQGYGWTSPSNHDMSVPHEVDLALAEFRAFPGGAAYWAEMTPMQGLCPGDSGSPDLRTTDAGTVLLGVLSGTQQCRAGQPSADYLSRNYAASGYLHMLNRALMAAGYLAIPGAPEAVRVTGVGQDVTVRWRPPSESPRTVVGYDVLDSSGRSFCSTPKRVCVLHGLAPGSYGFTVRARNADGEGQAYPIHAPQVTIG